MRGHFFPLSAWGVGCGRVPAGVTMDHRELDACILASSHPLSKGGYLSRVANVREGSVGNEDDVVDGVRAGGRRDVVDGLYNGIHHVGDGAASLHLDHTRHHRREPAHTRLQFGHLYINTFN